MHKFDNSQQWQDSFVWDWKIFAYSGHMDNWLLKETVTGLLTKQGFTLERVESNRIVVEYPRFNSSVEVFFTGAITSSGKHYALCFQSESLGIKKKDARNQKKLYNKVFSLIPQKWRKEAYWNKDGKYVIVYKTGHTLRQKRRRKM